MFSPFLVQRPFKDILLFWMLKEINNIFFLFSGLKNEQDKCDVQPLILDDFYISNRKVIGVSDFLIFD